MSPQDIVGVTTAAVATVIVALRIFTRLQIRHHDLDGSDYLYCAACIFMWIFVGFAIAQTEDQVAIWGRRIVVWEYIASTGQGLALCLIKLSILTFHLRLSQARWVRWVVRLLTFFMVSYTMLNIIFEALGFSPELAYTIDNATYPETIFWYVSNITTNLCCLLIPATIVLPLQLGLGKKLSIIALLGLGIISNAAGIWSLVLFQRATSRLDDEEHYFEARSEILSTNLLLTFIECNGGIICAGIPTIWIFFTQFLPGMIRYYLHPSEYMSSSTSPSTSTTVDRNYKRRHHLRSQTLSLEDMPPTMRRDSEEPRALHVHASESGTAIPRALPTIVEDDNLRTERDYTSSGGSQDNVELAKPPKAVVPGTSVHTDLAIERSESADAGPSSGTRFSYGSTLDSRRTS